MASGGRPIGGRGAQLLSALRRRQEEIKEAQEQEERAAAAEVTVLGDVLGATSLDVNTPSSTEGTSETTEGAEASHPAVAKFEDPAPALAPEPEVRTPVSKRGSSGTPLNLATNHIYIDVEEDKGVFEYAVRFRPNTDEVRERFQYLNQHREVVGSAKMFDGSKLLLPGKLPKEPTILHSPSSAGGDPVEITVSFCRKKVGGDPDCLSVYNALFKRVFKSLQLAPMRTGPNTSFYDPVHKHVLEKHRLEVWPGYVVGVDEFEGGVLLQCESSSKVMRTQTVLDVLTDCFKRSPASFRETALKTLLGANVITRYNNKTYKIDEVDFDSSPEQVFTNSKGQSLSFFQYYKNSYGIEIKDNKQPLIVCMMKRKDKEEAPIRICLIPELCFLTGLTDAQRADFRVMKDVAVFTRLEPVRRQEIIHKLLRSIMDCKEAVQILSDWGLAVSPKNLVQVQGRQLASTTLLFGKGYSENVGARGDWGRTSTTKPVLEAIPLDTWTLVCPARDARTAKLFLETFRQQAPKMGIKANKAPNLVTLQNDKVEAYLKAIRELPADTQIVVTMFSGTQRADRYAAVKKLCYLEKALASQVVMQKTLSNEKRLQAVVQKIVLQMNCKLGGQLWGCKIPVPHLMVIGVDVYRNKTGGNVAAIVATLNSTFSKYYSTVVLEKAGTAYTEELAVGIGKAVNRYHTVNAGKWPEKVVVYRDGVNSGQLWSNKREADAIRRAVVKSFEEESAGSAAPNDQTAPLVSVVVVQKRINTKIYQKTSSGKMDNPPAGTVLDHTVTLRDWYDFYLVSMSVRQGTVTPTHLVVTHDDVDWKPDTLQRLTYALTHMYFNWPGPVRVPAPCQYAHKLVEMVGEHLHKETHKDLEDKLFYL